MDHTDPYSVSANVSPAVRSLDGMELSDVVVGNLDLSGNNVPERV